MEVSVRLGRETGVDLKTGIGYEIRVYYFVNKI
jgi:hypothetical protein